MATVLITGANRGIGLALAHRYVERGDTVIATARDPGTASTLAALKGVKVHQADVTDAARLDALANELAAMPIDILICNAGVMGPRGAMSDAENTTACWASVLATNVTAVFFTARAFAPNVARAKGKIAIISSAMASSKAAAGTSYLYRASKAAAANLGANLAVELKGHGVAVGSYHPGWVKTDMGGPSAAIDVATSSSGLVRQIDRLNVDTTASFTNYDGTPIVY